MDSAGIGALVGAYVTHQKDGRSLFLIGVSERVLNALKVTRVEQFFQFVDSVSAAEQAIGKLGNKDGQDLPRNYVGDQSFIIGHASPQGIVSPLARCFTDSFDRCVRRHIRRRAQALVSQ